MLAIAPRIVTAAFYALLAIVAGSAIVAIGGSGIQPLRRYWERSLARMEEESRNIKRESQGAGLAEHPATACGPRDRGPSRPALVRTTCRVRVFQTDNWTDRAMSVRRAHAYR